MSECRRNPRWVDDAKGALYIAAYQDKLSNIWYYSSRIFPLFVANYYRQMLRLPKIGSVLIPMDNKKVSGWVGDGQWTPCLLTHTRTYTHTPCGQDNNASLPPCMYARLTGAGDQEVAHGRHEHHPGRPAAHARVLQPNEPLQQLCACGRQALVCPSRSHHRSAGEHSSPSASPSLSVSLYPIAREPPGPAAGSRCACLTMLSFPLARILGFFGCCCFSAPTVLHRLLGAGVRFS